MPKKYPFKFLFFTFFLVFSLTLATVQASAQPSPQNDIYHLKLLAVEETPDGFLGSDADLFLELKEGSGRVFLDTFPLTKMDTQISTRFAKEIACKYFKLNCKRYDFIYTIKAKSNIIGGPSAGAAIAALTTIAMLDLPYDEGITITGTINSGGIIGPVGGIKEKLEAAGKAELQKVLIAKGTALQKLFPFAKPNETQQTTESNETGEQKKTEQNQTALDIIRYGKENLSVEVLEVADLDDVIIELTGMNLNHKEVAVTENKEYAEIMASLRDVLCSRTEQLEQEIKAEGIILDNVEIIEQRKGKALNATKDGDYYSASSYCFAANIELKSAYYRERKLSDSMIQKLFAVLEKKTEQLEQKMALEEIKTISDLQTVSIVKERLNDVHTQIKEFKEGSRTQEELYSLLAYAEERLFSALSWTQFLAMDGKRFIIKPEFLQSSCLQKISEAEQRAQYVNLFIGQFHLQAIRQKIDTAKSSSETGEYAPCLLKAAEAKADANAILSSLGLSEETIDLFIESKRKAVERLIAENSKESIFPILGYSYYQYANSLQEEQKYTALVYLEYALEMSDLSIYFPEEKEFLEKVGERVEFNEQWVQGFAAGMVVMLILFFVLGKVGKGRKKGMKRG